MKKLNAHYMDDEYLFYGIDPLSGEQVIEARDEFNPHYFVDDDLIL